MHVRAHVHVVLSTAETVPIVIQCRCTFAVLPASAIASAPMMDLRDASIMLGLLRSTCWKSHAERSMPAAIPSAMYSPTLGLSAAVTTGTIFTPASIAHLSSSTHIGRWK